MFTFLQSWWLNIVTPCLIVLTITYYFCTSTFNKWKNLNVPYIQPIPLFGNFFNVALGIVHQVDFYQTVYDKLAGHRYGGLFQMRTPYLMIRDPELIKTILIKDFSYFPNRGIYSDFSINPLSNNLFFMENPQWKIMRNKLSPAFTSGKLKLMYDQIKECGNELMNNINKHLTKNPTHEIEIRNVMGNYSTDVIGSCVFGLKLNSISDENSGFRKHGKTILAPSLRILLRELSLMITPALLRVVKLKDFPADACEFFQSAFQETIFYREKNNIVRNDLVQYLMQSRQDLVLNKNLSPNGKDY